MTDVDAILRFRRRLREAVQISEAAYRVVDKAREAGRPVAEIQVHGNEAGGFVVIVRLDADWYAAGEIPKMPGLGAEDIQTLLWRALATIEADDDAPPPPP